jgi:CheY-like chemotaxis protein
LIDVMMPVMDGPQTLGHLREQHETAEIPVVFMTARAQARELAHFLSLGAAGVIPKPFDPMTLAGAVKRYLVPNAPDAEQIKRRFIVRARGDAAKLVECRSKIVIDPAASFPRIERIARSLAEAAAADFSAIGSAALVLARMAEEAENGIGNARDVERSIDQLLEAIDRDCRDGGDVQPNIRLA